MKFSKFVGLLVLFIGLYLLWRIRFVVLLAFLSVALATVLNRVVRYLMRWRLGRGAAIAVTLTVISAASALVLTVAVPPFVEQVSQWLNQVPFEVNRISIWIAALDDRLPVELSQQLQRLDTLIQDIPQILRNVFNNFFLFLQTTLSILVNVFLVIAVTVMLLANPKAYRHIFVALFPQFYRNRVEEILDSCEDSLVAWGAGVLFNMAVITGLSFAGLVTIGVPLPIANACIAGILTFIPNLGPTLSVIPPAVLGLLEAPWKGLAVIGLYVLIQQVESNVLTPLVMKRQVSLLPAITLISQLMMGVLFGFLGLFLALPIIVISQVWLRELLIKDVMDPWSEPT